MIADMLTLQRQRQICLNRRSNPAPQTLDAKYHVAWVLPPLSNSWITIIIWLHIALNRTPNIDCYWVGAVPKVSCLVRNMTPSYTLLLGWGQCQDSLNPLNP